VDRRPGKDEIPFTVVQGTCGCLGPRTHRRLVRCKRGLNLVEGVACLKEMRNLWLNIATPTSLRLVPAFDQWPSGARWSERIDDALRWRYRQEKQLLLIPARTAIQMQERGWILRNDISGYKPNVPPRHEKDRLPLTHEHFFHFVKKPTEGRLRTTTTRARSSHRSRCNQGQCGSRADGHSAIFADLIRPASE